jgi:hypothetical protein
VQRQQQLVDKIAVRALRIELIRRGLSTADLADLIGMSRHDLTVQLSKDIPSRVLRWRIERALGFPQPSLWSSDEEVEVRKRCILEFGADPRELGLVELKRLCRRLGTEIPAVRRSEEWFQRLVKWCRVNPGEERKSTK